MVRLREKPREHIVRPLSLAAVSNDRSQRFVDRLKLQKPSSASDDASPPQETHLLDLLVEFDEQLRKLLPEDVVYEGLRLAGLDFAELLATIVRQNRQRVRCPLEDARGHCERSQPRPRFARTKRTSISRLQEPKDLLERQLEERQVVLHEIRVPRKDEEDVAVDLHPFLRVRSRFGEREESSDKFNEPRRLVRGEDAEASVDSEGEGERIPLVLAEVDKASREGSDEPAKAVELILGESDAGDLRKWDERGT